MPTKGSEKTKNVNFLKIWSCLAPTRKKKREKNQFLKTWNDFFSQYSSALKVKCRGDLSQVYVNHSEIFKKYEVYIYA